MSNSFSTPWTVACQAPLSMGFSRQEYWSGLPFPSPGDLPDPGIEPGTPALQADSLPLSHQGSPCLSIITFKIEHRKTGTYILYTEFEAYEVLKNHRIVEKKNLVD